jgi:FixJ family two-component response regulator
MAIPDVGTNPHCYKSNRDASAEKAGAHLVLTKPFETVELIRSVEEVLGVGHA